MNDIAHGFQFWLGAELAKLWLFLAVLTLVFLIAFIVAFLEWLFNPTKKRL